MRAASDILASAVSKTRSTAIATRRGCSLDTSRTDRKGVTEKLSTSVMLVADDFERYTDASSMVDTQNWTLEPEPTGVNDLWTLFPGQTRELWAGRQDGKVDGAFAWNMHSSTPDKPEVDLELTVQARFKMLHVDPDRPRGVWGFGLLANYNDGKGYRFRVKSRSERSGWNVESYAYIEKLSSSAGSGVEHAYLPKPDDDFVRQLEGDAPDGDAVTARVAPDVWYRMKMRVKRENKVVDVSGKVWVEGSPEPDRYTQKRGAGDIVSAWAVGSAYDAWPDGKLPENQIDNFQDPLQPLSGGWCGVWVTGGAIAVDDFAVDARETWLLPGGIHMQARGLGSGINPYDPSFNSGAFDPDADTVALQAYEAGGFPLIYRADGTAAAQKTMLVRISDISTGDRRWVGVDPNTGRVEPLDDLLDFFGR
jgi:hypothetical protein